MAQEGRLDLLPTPLLAQMGTAELTLSFDLHSDRTLGQEDPVEVLDNLNTHGYHVQLPPPTIDSLLRKLNTD